MFRKIGIVLLVVVFLYLLFILLVIGVFSDYSTGERTGDIYKFSQKGIIWKSYEGTMYLGGVASKGSGGLEMEKFNFSIPAKEISEKSELIEKIIQCSQDREKICTIKYKQWFASPIYISSRYVVEDVIIK